MSLENSIVNESRFFIKTQDELNAESKEFMNENGINTDDGSIAVLFSDIINYNIANLYAKLNAVHLNYFLSTSSGIYLEDIAAKKSLTRNTDESDASLRNRVSIADRTNSTGNYYAIYNIVNIITEVTDVKIQEYVQGAGSFEVIIRANTPTQELLDKCTSYIKSVMPLGTKLFVNYPSYITVKFKIKINTNNATLTNKTDIEKNVINNIKTHMSNITPSSTLEKYELLGIIKNSDSKITSSSIIECTVDGEVVNFQQITSKYNEQFVLSSDSSIIFS